MAYTITVCRACLHQLDERNAGELRCPHCDAPPCPQTVTIHEALVRSRIANTGPAR